MFVVFWFFRAFSNCSKVFWYFWCDLYYKLFWICLSDSVYFSVYMIIFWIYFWTFFQTCPRSVNKFCTNYFVEIFWDFGSWNVENIENMRCSFIYIHTYIYICVYVYVYIYMYICINNPEPWLEIFCVSSWILTRRQTNLFNHKICSA